MGIFQCVLWQNVYWDMYSATFPWSFCEDIFHCIIIQSGKNKSSPVKYKFITVPVLYYQWEIILK